MPTYPKTGSNLDSTTKSSLSTQIIIMVENEPVGAIQSFNESQSRSVKAITEVGTDGIIELVPSGPTTVKLTINRMYFDGLSLPEAFSRGFRNLQSQRISFDIVVIDQFTGTGNDAIITTYHNCWFESIGTNYQNTDYTITQNANVACEYVSTIRGGEAIALSQGAGGGRQIPGVQIDSAEIAADSGANGRRGSLDFPGLISAAY
jgi:hypothetical protein